MNRIIIFVGFWIFSILPMLAVPSSSLSELSEVNEQPKQFEGSLLYVSDEFHNTATRKMSNGTAYIGERIVRIIIKGNAMHIEDLSTHLHEVILNDEQKVYIYSDLSNEGVEMPLSRYVLSHSMLDLNYTGTKEFPFEKTGEFKKVQTDDNLYSNCEIIQGFAWAGDMILARTEMSVDNYYTMPDVYRWYIHGYQPGGMIQRYLLSYTLQIPILGQSKSLVSCCLEDVQHRDVDDDEILPPKEISFKNVDQYYKVGGIQKRNNKLLKKLKLSPETIKEKEMRKRINENWPISETWLEYDVKSTTDAELYSSLIELVSSFINLTGSVKNMTSTIGSAFSSESIDNGNKARGLMDGSNDEEMLYIPDVISEIDQKLSPFRGSLANKGQTKMKLGKARINETAINGTLAHFEKIKASVIKYGRINKTEYIPKEQYRKLAHAQNVADDISRQGRDRLMDLRTKQTQSKLYGDYVEQLSRHAIHDKRDFDWDDFNWIKETQDKMKQLREKTGCEQSVWETWDGINNPL